MKAKKLFSILCVIALVVTMFSPLCADSSYTVKTGDVLWRIAKDHKVSTQELVDYNKIKNPNLIFPGDIINIPDANKTTEPKAPAKQLEKPIIKAKETTLTLLHTNDMHGFFIEGKYDGMGAAKVAAFIKSKKAENPNTLVLDAGDALQGANFVTISKGEEGTKVMNALGYDAMVAGNHEFDYGIEQMLKLSKMLNFPMLAANAKTEDGTPLLDGYKMFTVDDIKVGIFGLATPETKWKSHPDNTKGIVFESITDTAKDMVKTLKAEGANVIVGLVHLGDEGQYTSHLVANQVPEIDVLIDGHSHSTYENGKLVGNVLIGAAGEKTKNVGVIEIKLANSVIKEKKASLFTKEMSLESPEDTAVLKVVEAVNEANKPTLEKIVAKSSVKLGGEKENVRTGETNLGNLLTEALLDISKADVALTNGGGIRSSIPAGDVTVGDVLTVLPFGNTVRVIELKGTDIKAAIENGVSTYPEANGGFPHIAGMTVTFDANKPAGRRVVELKIGGKLLDVDKTYTLVTNDFLVAGGDNYSMFTGKKVVAEFGAMDEVLIDYMNKVGFNKAKIDGRIKEISNTASLLIQFLVA